MDALLEGLRPMADAIIEWLKATTLSAWMTNSQWLWPICETIHFIGLSLLVGIIGLLDFRLLGFMRSIPLSSLRKLLPVGIAGFVLNLVTGVMFFVGAPNQYMFNVSWWMKVLFLAVAGLNAMYFETTQGLRALAIPAGEPMPRAFKVAGGVSLFAWFMVIYWGRMLPFIGNAF